MDEGGDYIVYYMVELRSTKNTFCFKKWQKHNLLQLLLTTNWCKKTRA
jgi:hypothetical protein